RLPLRSAEAIEARREGACHDAASEIKVCRTAQLVRNKFASRAWIGFRCRSSQPGPESPRVCVAPSESETAVDQGPRRRPFRPQRNQNQQRQANLRPPGIRPPGNPRQSVANARINYERYT